MKRNKFSLSAYRLQSMKMGGLYPCGWVEVHPGDTFQHAASMLIRVAPLVAPVMHPVHARVHHWFVPYRVLWDGWEKFITGGDQGSTPPVFPYVNVTQPMSLIGGLYDYLGVPPFTDVGGNLAVSAMPARAYAMIFNEWYRDQDLTSLVPLSKDDDVDTVTNNALLNVAWMKDYLTTSRPWTQKGPQVTVPLDIKGIGIVANAAGASVGPVNVTEADNVTRPYAAYWPPVNPAAPSTEYYAIEAAAGSGPGGGRPNIFGDMSVNDLRLAMGLQRWEEARARHGSRYVEYLRYYGVKSSDARLQRPEYLGGGKQTIQFSEVLQTGVTTNAEIGGVGNMAGHGIGALRSNRYRRFFEEHGIVMSLISIRPITMYSQAMNRSWFRRVKEDFFTPELQHIGQQEVYNREVAVTNDVGNLFPNLDGIFGYQDRYDEYRRMENTVAGAFRGNTLNYWHLARTFATQPVLNSSFVVSNPSNRIFADQTGSDQFYVMINHSLQARRMMAAVGTSHIY